MVKREIINQYLNAGKKLTLLNGKIPVVNCWTEKIIPKEKLYSHKGNIGWVLGKEDLVIDIDVQNGGDKSFKKFRNRFEEFIYIHPTVMTPQGGFHIYLKIPKIYQNKKFYKNKKDFSGIDFLTKGSQCLIPSCSIKDKKYEWADELFGEYMQNELSNSGIFNNFILHETNLQLEMDLGDFDGLIDPSDSYQWAEDKVIEMIKTLDPNMPHDDWIRVGMALHNWNPVEGLAIWDNWSKNGDTYKEKEPENRWKSFTTGGGITLGTISHMNKLVQFDETIERVSKYLDRIKYANEQILEFEIIPEIKKQNLSVVNKEKLVKAIQDRYKDLSGIRMPISNIRKMITEVVSGVFIEDNESPGWCRNWIYVNSHSGFINTKTLALHKSESFNVENGKFIPITEGGSKSSAIKYVSDKGFIKKVDMMAYLPTYNELICNIDGHDVLNSFNPKTIPIESEDFTDEGLEAIEIVKQHIKFICTTNQNSHIFTQWLAFQVQYPGVKILWSPVIQSIQGVGKSFFGELLRICLGDKNIGTVSPSQVTSDFNGWATHVIVNVLEELRVKGHNRFDAVNALKPLITDRMIQINEKGVKQYTTYNTTNYICFTNYKDSLPLDGDDRRWWVVFVPIESLEEMENYVGETADNYFIKLFNAVRNYGSEIRKWLLEFHISKKFLQIKQAPMTEHKKSMIATEEASFEGLSEIRDLIEKGGKYFNNDVICSVDLFESLLFEHSDLEFKTTQKNAILKKLGYLLKDKPMKIDGKARKIWTKKPMENEEILNLLIEKVTNVDNL